MNETYHRVSRAYNRDLGLNREKKTWIEVYKAVRTKRIMFDYRWISVNARGQQSAK